MLGRIEWAAVGKQVFPGRPAITPQIAMKPATLCFVFDPGFVRSAYVRLCVDSERSVSSGLYVETLQLLDDVFHERAEAETVFVEAVRVLINMRDETLGRMASLMQSLKRGEGALPLASEAIVILL